MYKFQLYKSVEDNFPTKLEVEGATYPISADYRNILKMFKIQERNDISQLARNLKILQLFYKDGYPEDNPFFYFSAFVSRMKKPEANNSPPVMDYFYDADVIYTSVKMQYGIDLISVPYLHWYEFLMLVEGLGENTPLQERIRIRTAKIDGLKGKDLQDLQRAKKRVALPSEGARGEQANVMAKFGIV